MADDCPHGSAIKFKLDLVVAKNRIGHREPD